MSVEIKEKVALAIDAQMCAIEYTEKHSEMLKKAMDMSEEVTDLLFFNYSLKCKLLIIKGE